MTDQNDLALKLRHVPDFPKKGVLFYDITPLLEDADALKRASDDLASAFRNDKIDKVVGIDARGFLLASPVAYILGAGLVLVRKKGKLPHDTIREYHELEYGTSALEMHTDAIRDGERIAVIDDVLATGGTADATIRLVTKLGGIVVGLGFLAEITNLKGRERLAHHRIHSLITL